MESLSSLNLIMPRVARCRALCMDENGRIAQRTQPDALAHSRHGIKRRGITMTVEPKTTLLLQFLPESCAEYKPSPPQTSACLAVCSAGDELFARVRAMRYIATA